MKLKIVECSCTTCEENTQEKHRWPDGPWKTEPNRVEFRHAGFACLLHRNCAGVWCGYVAVSPNHPCYGIDHDSVYYMAEKVGVDLDVHGGLTYSDKCRHAICHEPEPGASDDVWWLGFDNNHPWDYAPGIDYMLRYMEKIYPGFSTACQRLIDGHYWTLEETIQETKNLAKTLQKLAAALSKIN